MNTLFCVLYSLYVIRFVCVCLESLRSVSCDYEGQFMCGYTHNGSLTTDAAYVWSREHNRRPGQGINIGTGPIYDHTFQNESGQHFSTGEEQSQTKATASGLQPDKKTQTIEKKLLLSLIHI